MDEDKQKAEKIAAAKKKLDQMRKAKAKKAGGGTKKGESAAAPAPTTEDTPPSPATDAPEKQEDEQTQEQARPATEDFPTIPEDATADVRPTSPGRAQSTSTPSLAQQSKARSASFRQGSISVTGAGPLSPGSGAGMGLFSPEGETAPDIYRKHVQRIEELEKENKALAKDAKDAKKRWQKAEEELADLRERDVAPPGEGGEEVGKMKTEIAALQRQNAQLQAQLTRRHGASPSISMTTPPAAATTAAATAELEAQLRSKSATIETMELEMSRLRAQVERLSVSASTPSEQIAALEEKLARAEQAAGLAQRELHDVKVELEQAAKRAVVEGSGRASAETKLRALELQAAEAVAAREELVKKAEGLEKKAATLATLHREQDGRTQAVRREKEGLEKEVAELRGRLARTEAENVRLRKRDAAEGGGDDDAVDELEEEERLRLERKVRELEAENTDLRRGIWHEKRKEMQVGPDEANVVAGVGGRFETVDLGGFTSPSARKGAGGSGGGLGDFFASGLTALTGGVGTPGGHQVELLEDDDMEFDEEAFRRAQEEEQKKRIERIKEIKRSLKNWEGWRLDLVENRRGGGEGIGEIFESIDGLVSLMQSLLFRHPASLGFIRRCWDSPISCAFLDRSVELSIEITFEKTFRSLTIQHPRISQWQLFSHGDISERHPTLNFCRCSEVDLPILGGRRNMESLVPAEISASEVLWPAVNNKRKRDETETADEAGARLLTTGSQWPLALSTTDIRGLAEIWAAGDFHRKTSEFVPTARDVAVTAMASVDFVQSLEGGTVHASSIGIDHAGRLFQKPKNFVGEDFWEDFCEMVNELREKSLQLTVKDRIVTLIGIFLEFKSDYDRLNNSESKYALLCLFKVVEGLKKGDGVQSTGRLEEVHDECQKVCEVLNKVISAIDVVQQDLIDTGSTSLQRWNRSRKIQGAFAVDQPLSDLCTYVVKLRFYMEPYQRFLGATSQLRDCLA